MSPAATIRDSRSTWARHDGLCDEDLDSDLWAFELRRGLRLDFEELEATELNRAMSEARISRPRYLDLLRQSRLILEALEDALEALPSGARIVGEDQRRAAVLRRDLKILNAPGPLEALPSTAKALELIASLRRRRPVALLGLVYVQEAARLSSVLLYRRLSQALAIPAEHGRGLDAHLEGLTEGFERFHAFKQRLNDAVSDSEDRRRIVQVARLFLAITKAMHKEIEAPRRAWSTPA